MRLTGLHLSGIGGQDVVKTPLEPKLPDCIERLRSRAESRDAVGAPEIVATQKADLRHEVVLDHEVLCLESVPVSRIEELPLVARIIRVQTRGLGLGDIGQETDVVIERKGAVDAIRPVGPVTGQRHGPVGKHGADAAATKDVSFYTQHGKVRRLDTRPRHIVGLNVQHADIERARLPSHTPATDDRGDGPVLEPDPPRMEQRRRIDIARIAAVAPSTLLTQRTVPRALPAATACEAEDALPFEKELALLGKEETESRQVDLLLVGLDLGEVGVVGQVGGQILRDAVLDVDADVAAAGIPYGWAGAEVGGQAGDDKRFDLEVVAGIGRLETNHRGRI